MNELRVRGKGRRVSESEATIRVSQRHELLEKKLEQRDSRGMRGGCKWQGPNTWRYKQRLGQQPPGPMVGWDNGSPLSLWSANVFEPMAQHLALSWITQVHIAGDWAYVTGIHLIGVGSLRKPCCAGAGLVDSSSSRGTSRLAVQCLKKPFWLNFQPALPLKSSN